MKRVPLLILLMVCAYISGFAVSLFAASNVQSLNLGTAKKVENFPNRKLSPNEVFEFSANSDLKALQILKETALPAIPKITITDAEILAKDVWHHVNHKIYKNIDEVLSELRIQICHELTLGAKEIVIKRSDFGFDTYSVNVIALLPNNISGHFYRIWKIDDGRFVAKAAHKELAKEALSGKYAELIMELSDPFGPDRNYRPEYYKAQEILEANWKTSIVELFDFFAAATEENDTDGVMQTLFGIAKMGEAPCSLMAEKIGSLDSEAAKNCLHKILYCRQNWVDPTGAGGNLLRACILNSKSYPIALEFIDSLGTGRFGKGLSPLVAEIMLNEKLERRTREKFSQILRSYGEVDCEKFSTIEEMAKWWQEKGKNRNWGE